MFFFLKPVFDFKIKSPFDANKQDIKNWYIYPIVVMPKYANPHNKVDFRQCLCHMMDAFLKAAADENRFLIRSAIV